MFMGFGLGGYPTDTSGSDHQFSLLSQPYVKGVRLSVYSASEGLFGRGIVVREEHDLIGPWYFYRKLCDIHMLEGQTISIDNEKKVLILKGKVFGQDSTTLVPL
jgi:hypothetical protein